MPLTPTQREANKAFLCSLSPQRYDAHVHEYRKHRMRQQARAIMRTPAEILQQERATNDALNAVTYGAAFKTACACAEHVPGIRDLLSRVCKRPINDRSDVRPGEYKKCVRAIQRRMQGDGAGDNR